MPTLIHIFGEMKRRRARPAFRRQRRFAPKQFAGQARFARPRPRQQRNVRTGGFLGIEKKFLDAGASAVAIVAPTDAAGGEIQPEFGCTNTISAPAQGNTEQQRDGNQIKVLSVFVSGLVAFAVLQAQADVLSLPVVSVAIVLDTQTNATAINSEDVYVNPNDTPQVNGFLMRNLSNSSRFRVLARKTIRAPLLTNGTDGASTLSMTGNNIPFKLSSNEQFLVRFNTGTTANVSTVTTNSLHVIAFCTSTAFTPTLSYNSRVRFVG